MRIMFDTNVLLSAAIFPNNRMNSIVDYVTKEHVLVLSDLVVEEFLEVAGYKKFQRVRQAREFLKKLSFVRYKTPAIVRLKGVSIRDDGDYEILFSAIKSNVDLFITRDKDFLSCGVSQPRMMTLNDFEAEFMPSKSGLV